MKDQLGLINPGNILLSASVDCDNRSRQTWWWFYGLAWIETEAYLWIGSYTTVVPFSDGPTWLGPNFGIIYRGFTVQKSKESYLMESYRAYKLLWHYLVSQCSWQLAVSLGWWRAGRVSSSSSSSRNSLSWDTYGTGKRYESNGLHIISAGPFKIGLHIIRIEIGPV